MSNEKKRILIVDDSEVVRKILTMKLAARNFEVLSASDGAEAMNSVRTIHPDAILLDISFPAEVFNATWDGFQILEWFKRLDALKETPVFIISNGDPAVYGEKASALGAAGYFRKPVKHEELIVALERALSIETSVAS